MGMTNDIGFWGPEIESAQDPMTSESNLDRKEKIVRARLEVNQFPITIGD